MEEATGIIVRPVMEISAAKEMFASFQKIKSDVLGDKDFNEIPKGSGKHFINKQGWRKIKTMFGFTAEILDRQRLQEDKLVRYIYRVRVKSQNGIFADAEGSCDTEEPFAYLDKKTGTKKPENMIMAMAQTRSFNRAISDLVGGGEVSAEEEAEDAPKQNGHKFSMKCTDCGIDITEQVASYSTKFYEKELCKEHQKNYQRR